MFVAFCIKDRGKKVCIDGKKEVGIYSDIE